MPIRQKISRGARNVISELQAAGYQALLVGGAVRDLLLGIPPKDHDVATDATPEEVHELFGRRARLIGRRFRLAHVHAGREIIEVSTFRREPTEDERKGRENDDGTMVWRDNEYGNLTEDARRRDFTINAIYFDPLAPEGSGIIDIVGGHADLDAGIVRAIGEAQTRLAEDPVRLLRACKLMGQYGFRPEASLAKALPVEAEKIGLSSAARLVEELYKIYQKPCALPILAACQEFGLLRHYLPALSHGWETPAGRLAQRCLEVRDQGIASGDLYPSRVTGLCATVLPFAADAFGEGPLDQLWENYLGVNKDIRTLVRDFFEPHRLPRYTVAKMCDVLLLQPKFVAGKGRRRVLRHPEYNRARDTFHVLAKVLGLPRGEVEQWPPQQSKPGRRRRPRKHENVG